MKKLIQTLTFSIAAMLFFSSATMAQEALKQKPSPLGLVTFKYEDAYIKVTYGRPHKRDRVIFGELVPFGEVWRTGANEATEITITKPVKMGGKKIEPGTYSVFTIPQEDKWTIIFNKDLGQWGAYKYDEKKDLLRFEVPTSESEVAYEPFTIMFDQKGDDISMKMVWDSTMVSIPIEFID
jgi:hypothetical protein